MAKSSPSPTLIVLSTAVGLAACLELPPVDPLPESRACTAESRDLVCGDAPCVDGFCCDQACEGLCRSCALQGREGRCTPIPRDSDPESECEDAPCMVSACDGEGGCAAGVPLPDFTRCETLTVPDRSYDICVSGECVSPGCGKMDCNTPGPHFPLPDTGQRLCFSEGASVDCGDERVSPSQDALTGWDRFHPAAARYHLSVTNDAERITVQDTITGLTWQGCAAGLGGPLCSEGEESPSSWTEALAYCDALEWGGRDDWRLPDRYELLSIINSNYFSPAVDIEQDFPNTPLGEFWTSTMYEDSQFGQLPICVCFLCGDSYPTGPQYLLQVRCVSGDPTPASGPRFSELARDASTPSVADAHTGLIWQSWPAPDGNADVSAGDAGCDSGCDEPAPGAIRDWEAALTYCDTLTAGGHSDWRLPNVIELVSIIDSRHSSSALPAELAPAATTRAWSSTTYLGDTEWAWYVDFSDGMVDYLDKTELDYLDKEYRVSPRCVREADGTR